MFGKGMKGLPNSLENLKLVLFTNKLEDNDV